MTKREAAEKVAKLHRLAERAGSPAEADNARRAAEKIIAENHLSGDDLYLGSKCAAFDDMLDMLEGYVAGHPDRSLPMGVLTETLSRMKNDTKPEDKASALNKFVSGIRLASMLRVKAVVECKNLVDTVLQKHNVVV